MPATYTSYPQVDIRDEDNTNYMRRGVTINDTSVEEELALLREWKRTGNCPYCDYPPEAGHGECFDWMVLEATLTDAELWGDMPYTPPYAPLKAEFLDRPDLRHPLPVQLRVTMYYAARNSAYYTDKYSQWGYCYFREEDARACLEHGKSAWPTHRFGFCCACVESTYAAACDLRDRVWEHMGTWIGHNPPPGEEETEAYALWDEAYTQEQDRCEARVKLLAALYPPDVQEEIEDILYHLLHEL